MSNMLRCYMRNEAGATAIEYGLIAGTIALVLVAGLNLVVGGVSGSYAAIAASFP